MSEVSATIECPHCYLTGGHRIQCPDFTGQIDRESLEVSRKVGFYSTLTNEHWITFEFPDKFLSYVGETTV